MFRKEIEMSKEEIKEKDESEYEYVERVGYCIYCGQSRMVNAFEGDIVKASSEEEYVNLLATEKCDCSEAKVQRHIKQQMKRAKEYINKYFKADFPETAEILNYAVVMIIDGKFDKITIDTGKKVKGIVQINSKGNIKVQRKATNDSSMEV